MGDEADADWQDGLVEWGISDAKRAEIDAISDAIARKARQYVASGMSYEQAEQRACKDIQRARRRS
jgi:hypothetical protein